MNADPVEMLPDSSHITPQSSKQIISKILKEDAPTLPAIAAHSELNAFKAKIKEQALQLQALDDYRQLCEARIREIAPDHPLPLEKNHLGKKMQIPKSSQSPQKIKLIQDLRAELNRTKEEMISMQKRLSSQPEYGDQFKQIEEQKAQLELSLRAEILANEEQRNYIEILKEAMEAKIESLGLGQVLEQFCKNRDEKLELFSQFMLIQSKTEEYNKLVQNTEGARTELEKQLNDYSQEVKRNRNELNNAKEAYTKANAELESTINALQNSNEQLDQLQARNEALVKDSKKYSSQISELQNNLNSLTQENTKLSDEASQLSENNKVMLDDKNNMQAKHQELEDQATELKQQLQIAEDSIKEYDEKFINDRKTIEGNQNSIHLLSSKVTTLNEQNEDLTGKLETATNEGQKLLEDYNKLKENSDSQILELSNKCSANDNIIRENTEKIQQFEGTIKKSTQQLQLQAKEIQELSSINKSLTDELDKEKELKEQSELNCKAAFNKLASEKEEVGEKYETLSKEIDSIKKQSIGDAQAKATMQSELGGLKVDNEKLRKEIEGIKIENVTLYQDNTKLRNQWVEIKKEMIEKQEKYESQLSDLKALQEQCEDATMNNQISEEKEKANMEQIKMLNNEIAEREATIEKHTMDKDMLNQQIRQLSIEIDEYKTKYELANSKENDLTRKIDESNATITKLSDACSQYNTKITKYELMLSKASESKEQMEFNAKSNDAILKNKVQLLENENADIKSKYTTLAGIIQECKITTLKQLRAVDTADALKSIIENYSTTKAQLDNQNNEKSILKKDKIECERHLLEANMLLTNKEREDNITKERTKYLENEVKALKTEIEQGEREKCLLKKQNVRLETDINSTKMKSFQFNTNEDEKDKLQGKIEYIQKIADDNAGLADKLDEKLKQVTQQKNFIEGILHTAMETYGEDFKTKVMYKLPQEQKTIFSTFLEQTSKHKADDMTIMEERIRMKLDELKEKMATIHSNIQSRSFREKQYDSRELSSSFSVFK